MAAAPQVSWVVPDDGGTPRDPNRIVAVGPREFRIAAVAERWFDPRTGEQGAAFRIEGGTQRSFRAPDDGDWALLLTTAGTAIPPTSP